MKIVTAEIMQQVDRKAITERGIPGLFLMENAGRGCAAAITGAFGTSGSATIIAGKGNNGGDGFVIARLLAAEGWDVQVCILARRDQIKGDALANLNRLPDTILAFCPEWEMLAQHAGSWISSTVIIDAIFGTGLASDLSGVQAEAVRLVNTMGKPVVAVDIPSGVHGTTGKVLGSAIRADLTVTFALAKQGHVQYPGAEYCGKLQVVDIGIPADIMAEAAGCEYGDAPSVASLLRKRSRTSHKGSCGHCLIIAGSTGKTGAAAMAANSAVRAGSGLVTVAVPAAVHQILEIKTTEAMTIPVSDNGSGFLGADALDMLTAESTIRDVVAIGPGLSWHPDTAELVRSFAVSVAQPVVIDADGLNAVSEDVGILFKREGKCTVLTPHPGEMARLAGVSTAAVEADRLGLAEVFARRYGVYLILKGARSVIAAPDGRLAINGSGNPGMASGGMGDVLTGAIAALLAQGYDPFDACRIAVFVHGHAADLVAAEKGEIGMSAVDVQERLPYAFNDLLRRTI